MLFFMFRRYTSVATSHPNASAPESPINILAGFILNIRNAKSAHATIPSTVVARYQPYVKVIIENTPNTITIIPPARPSNPSVILIAFTIAIVRKKVMIGYQNPR